MMRSLALLCVIVSSLSGSPAWATDASPKPAGPPITIRSLDDTVLKMALAKGVSPDDAKQSMKLRANLLNMHLVAELPLSKQVSAITGKPSPYVTIFQFCDALTARAMLDYNLDFAAYLPCRIALVEDGKGHGWLVMMDLDMIVNLAHLNPELKAKAIAVRDKLQDIMRAGANGDL
ncbi:MAG TPA: DUF302 domain-containing protein [Casimicrobiaceae bacterium]|nr:DUF302 domain-containing protein [Casimicrobiaceae bacterium]